MANIFESAPVYITATDVKDTTTITGLSTLPDQDVEVLITKAQQEIDGWICRTFWPPVDEDQLTLFPVTRDKESYLPNDITVAAFYVVEKLYLSGQLVTNTPSWSRITQEKTGPRTVSLEYVRNLQWFVIPDIAVKLLNKYKKRFMGIRK